MFDGVAITAQRGDGAAVLVDEFACDGLFHDLLHLTGQLTNNLIQLIVNINWDSYVIYQ